MNGARVAYVLENFGEHPRGTATRDGFVVLTPNERGEVEIVHRQNGVPNEEAARERLLAYGITLLAWGYQMVPVEQGTGRLVIREARDDAAA